MKPMNCPGHMLLFRSQLWSYRDLPVRYAEAGPLHRNELGGHAPRPHPRPVRDAGRRSHLLHAGPDRRRARRCDGVPRATSTACSASSRGRSSRRGPTTSSAPTTSGTSRRASCVEALSRYEIEYFVGEGEGSFYGPKIDLHATDSLGRSWQLGTIQLDAQMPARFGLTYMGADNREHPVFVIHRALLRLVRAVRRARARALRRRAPDLARARAGAGPPGCGAPCRGGRRARRTRSSLAGVRVDADEREETLGKRIRDAELQKIPYVVVWGDRETREAMAVRRRGGEGVETLSLDGLVEEIREQMRRASVARCRTRAPAATLRDLQAGAASPLTSPATGRARFNRVGSDEGMPPLHAVAFPRNEEDRLDLVNCL